MPRVWYAPAPSSLTQLDQLGTLNFEAILGYSSFVLDNGDLHTEMLRDQPLRIVRTLDFFFFLFYVLWTLRKPPLTWTGLELVFHKSGS